MPGRKAASLPAPSTRPTAARSDGHMLDPTGPCAIHVQYRAVAPESAVGDADDDHGVQPRPCISPLAGPPR